MSLSRSNLAPMAPPGVIARLFPPLGAKHLALFYKQLGTMLAAGVAIGRAVEVAGRGLSNPLAGSIMARIKADLEAGNALFESLGQFPHVFRPLHVEMIRAGEESGDLPAVLRELVRGIEDAIAERRRLVSELVRPVITLHALFLISPIPAAFLGQIGLGGYLLRAFGPLAPLYAIGIGTWAGLRLRRFSQDLRLRGIRLIHAVPMLGSAVRKLGIARMATALRALYEAGMDIERALPLAGRAAGNEAIRRACEEAAAQFPRGATLHEALAATGEFPERTLSMIFSGEESGRLDEMLAKIAETHAEEARHTIHTLGRIFSFGVYLFIAGMVAFYIISTYQRIYLGPIQDALRGV